NLLTQALPGISRVLVLTYLADPIAHLQVQALQNAARALGVTLQVQDIRASDDLPAAFESGVTERAEGLITTAETMFYVIGAQVPGLAARHRLPRYIITSRTSPTDHNLLELEGGRLWKSASSSYHQEPRLMSSRANETGTDLAPRRRGLDLACGAPPLRPRDP